MENCGVGDDNNNNAMQYFRDGIEMVAPYVSEVVVLV